MSTRAYTVLGWSVWQVATRVAKRKLRENRVKLRAGAAVAGVLVAGVVAAKAASGDDD